MEDNKFCRVKVGETLNGGAAGGISMHIHPSKMQELGLIDGDIVLLKAMGNLETLCVVYSDTVTVDSDQVRVNEIIKTFLRIRVGDIVILMIVARNSTSQLIDAADRGLLSIVQYLVRIVDAEKRYSFVNEKATNGISPLCAASLEGHYDVMEFLVSSGSEKDYTMNRLKWSTIHWVAVSGDVSAMLQLLDEHNPNVAVDTTADDGWIGPYQGPTTTEQGNIGGGRTALHFASSNNHTEMVKLLLQHGADANYADRKGWTPLYRAAAKGHLNTVECLVQHGADINLANHMGFYPLITAAAGGHFDIVKYLAENNAQLNTPTKNGWNPVGFAALNGFLDMMIYLKERGVDMDSATPDGFTPILYAAWGGHVPVLEYLVGLGYSPSYTPVSDGNVFNLLFPFLSYISHISLRS